MTKPTMRRLVEAATKKPISDAEQYNALDRLTTEDIIPNSSPSGPVDNRAIDIINSIIESWQKWGVKPDSRAKAAMNGDITALETLAYIWGQREPMPQNTAFAKWQESVRR